MPFKRGQLRNFLVIAEEGQMTRAAKRLHVAQPALSQSIAQLEAELGIALLARHPRGVRLTPAGEAFLPKARAAVLADEEAAMTARALAHGEQERLELGFFGIPPSAHSPELLASFGQARPDVELCFRELPMPSGTTSSWIRDVDIVLCHHCLSEPGIHQQLVRVERRVLLASTSHPLAQRREIRVAEVIGETFISFAREADPQWTGFWQLDDHRGRPARTSLDHVRTPIEMLATIAGGHVISTAPECHANVVVKVLPGLVAVPIVDADPARLRLAWRSENDGPVIRDLAVAAARLLPNRRTGERRALDPTNVGLEQALENVSDRLGERRERGATARSQPPRRAKPRPTG